MRGIPHWTIPSSGEWKEWRPAILFCELLPSVEVHNRLLLNRSQASFVSVLTKSRHTLGVQPIWDNYRTRGKLYKCQVDNCPNQHDPTKIPCSHNVAITHAWSKHTKKGILCPWIGLDDCKIKTNILWSWGFHLTCQWVSQGLCCPPKINAKSYFNSTGSWAHIYVYLNFNMFCLRSFTFILTTIFTLNVFFLCGKVEQPS